MTGRLRAGLKENGKLSTFLYYNGEILAECGGGKIEDSVPVRRYQRGISLFQVEDTAAGINHTYSRDEQKSTVYITGSDGAVENCYAYDAFGNVLESRESIENRIRYTGQQHEEIEAMKCINESLFYDCGQKFYKINRIKWAELQRNNDFNGVGLDSKWLVEKVDKMISFTECNTDFFCAITKASINNVKEYILPMLFYATKRGHIRVRIEHVKCANCGWKGSIANPILPDLYELVPNKFDMMKKGYQIPTMSCPNCKKELERYAIWVER